MLAAEDKLARINLDAWTCNPLEAEFLELKALEFSDRIGQVRIISNDNRRLYCLKAHQEHVRHLGWTVYVRVRVTRLPKNDALRRFMERFDGA